MARKKQEYIYIVDNDDEESEAPMGETSMVAEPSTPGPSEPTDQDRATSPAAPPTHTLVPEYTRPDWIRMFGATAPDRTPWIQVQVDGDEGPDEQPSRSVWTLLADWEGDASAARRRLSAAHIHLPPDEFKQAVSRVWCIKEFPALPLIERPGWTFPHNALPSGDVFSPEGTEPAVVLFDRDPQRCTAKGTLSEWLEGVARIASGQWIITFVLMLAFVPALLKLSPVLFNPGFELTGPKRRGKSTLQQLVASIMGPAVEPHGRNYLITANATVNALEAPLQDHADLPLLIDEMGVYYAGETEKARSQKMRELVMRFSDGTPKARKGELSPPKVRLLYLTSANETLTSMFGELTWALSAAGDRLLTIPVAEARKFGIFDKLPRGCSSSKEAIRAIVDLVKHQHGTSIRAYLQQLVVERAANEPALTARIEALINEVREAVGVDDDAGPESSIADVFGLVYAAGMLAQAYGALPQKLKLLRATVKVYTLNRSLSSPPLTNLERLQRLAERRGVIKVDARNLKDVSDEELEKAPATLYVSRKGTVHLLLTDAQLARAFPVPARVLKDPDIVAVMRIDKDERKKFSVTIRANHKPERFYAFALAALTQG